MVVRRFSGCYETQCALTTVEQDCRNPVPQARNNRSPARSRRRSAGLSGKFDSSPEGTAPFRNTLFSAALAGRFLGFEPGFNPAALPVAADTATLVFALKRLWGVNLAATLS